MCINKSLSVEGLLLEKQRLEESIAQAVAALVLNFNDRTGLDIRAVDVPVIDCSTITDRRQRYRVGAVAVTTNLF